MEEEGKLKRNKKKLKVLFISAANCIHTIRWVNALSEYFEIHLVYCNGHNVTLNKPNSEIILHELKYKAPIGYYTNSMQLKKLYNEIKPDIVNVHYATGYCTLARIAKIPLGLLSVWGSDVYDFPNESKIKRKILEKNVKYAKNIASTSNIMANELKKQFPKLEKNIYITPFGVDTSKFIKFNQQRENNNKEIYIGNVKTLKEKYGIRYAILAIKELKDDLAREQKNDLSNYIKMKIYGDGEEKESLQNLINENNLKDSVFLMGAIPNEQVPKALNGLDIFCATSILNSESFGVAVVEAMACELPVIATNVDGFCEVMDNEKTGYVVNKKDVKDIAAGLKKLVLDSESRKRMGKEGRKRVEQLYDWESNVKTMSNIYMKVIKEESLNGCEG